MTCNPVIDVCKDADALAIAAATRLRLAAVAAIAARGRFLLVLAGGGTPDPLYRRLVDGAADDGVDWARVYLFWGDERCVPPDDPGSNYGQALRTLGGLVPAANIERMRGELAPPAAAADYAERLARWGDGHRPWPRFDLVLLGLGSDGHTASLFPGSPAAADDGVSTLAVTADYEDRPANRVTLTPAVFNAARQVIFLVVGAAKAEAAAAVLGPAPDLLRWPAARIRPDDGLLVWLLDRPAAGMLRRA